MSESEGSENIKIIIIPMTFNAILGVLNRILQICYYCVTRYKGVFQTDTVRETALAFCIFPTMVNVFMMGSFCILHKEEMLTPKVKLQNFIRYVLSLEILYPIGVHKSLRTKYSYNDDPLVTLRLINAIHFVFVALPQALIVTINSSASENFKGIDIASLIFSFIFMIWSIGYYFLCINYRADYDDYITDIIDKEKNE